MIYEEPSPRVSGLKGYTSTRVAQCKTQLGRRYQLRLRVGKSKANIATKVIS